MEEMKFIDDSKLQQYFQKEFLLIVNESDRGAVLLGLTILEETLKKNLRKMIPKDFIDDKDTICNGDLKATEKSIDSNLSKLLLLRIIPLHLYKSIKKINILRNRVAHNILDFKLKDNVETIKESGNLISINGNLYSNINELAYNLIYSDLLNGIIKLSKTNDLKTFNSYNEVVEYMENNTHLLQKKLDNSLYKTEFAILIFYLYSFINFHFEKALELVGDNNTLSTISIKKDKDE